MSGDDKFTSFSGLAAALAAEHGKSQAINTEIASYKTQVNSGILNTVYSPEERREILTRLNQLSTEKKNTDEEIGTLTQVAMNAINNLEAESTDDNVRAIAALARCHFSDELHTKLLNALTQYLKKETVASISLLQTISTVLNAHLLQCHLSNIIETHWQLPVSFILENLENLSLRIEKNPAKHVLPQRLYEMIRTLRYLIELCVDREIPISSEVSKRLVTFLTEVKQEKSVIGHKQLPHHDQDTVANAAFILDLLPETEEKNFKLRLMFYLRGSSKSSEQTAKGMIGFISLFGGTSVLKCIVVATLGPTPLGLPLALLCGAEGIANLALGIRALKELTRAGKTAVKTLRQQDFKRTIKENRSITLCKVSPREMWVIYLRGLRRMLWDTLSMHAFETTTDENDDTRVHENELIEAWQSFFAFIRLNCKKRSLRKANIEVVSMLIELLCYAPPIHTKHRPLFYADILNTLFHIYSYTPKRRHPRAAERSRRRFRVQFHIIKKLDQAFKYLNDNNTDSIDTLVTEIERIQAQTTQIPFDLEKVYAAIISARMQANKAEKFTPQAEEMLVNLWQNAPQNARAEIRSQIIFNLQTHVDCLKNITAANYKGILRRRGKRFHLTAEQSENYFHLVNQLKATASPQELTALNSIIEPSITRHENAVISHPFPDSTPHESHHRANQNQPTTANDDRNTTSSNEKNGLLAAASQARVNFSRATRSTRSIRANPSVANNQQQAVDTLGALDTPKGTALLSLAWHKLQGHDAVKELYPTLQKYAARIRAEKGKLWGNSIYKPAKTHSSYPEHSDLNLSAILRSFCHNNNQLAFAVGGKGVGKRDVMFNTYCMMIDSFDPRLCIPLIVRLRDSDALATEAVNQAIAEQFGDLDSDPVKKVLELQRTGDIGFLIMIIGGRSQPQQTAKDIYDALALERWLTAKTKVVFAGLPENIYPLLPLQHIHPSETIEPTLLITFPEASLDEKISYVRQVNYEQRTQLSQTRATARMAEEIRRLGPNFKPTKHSKGVRLQHVKNAMESNIAATETMSLKEARAKEVASKIKALLRTNIAASEAVNNYHLLSLLCTLVYESYVEQSSLALVEQLKSVKNQYELLNICWQATNNYFHTPALKDIATSDQIHAFCTQAAEQMLLGDTVSISNNQSKQLAQQVQGQGFSDTRGLALKQLLIKSSDLFCSDPYTHSLAFSHSTWRDLFIATKLRDALSATPDIEAASCVDTAPEELEQQRKLLAKQKTAELLLTLPITHHPFIIKLVTGFLAGRHDFQDTLWQIISDWRVEERHLTEVNQARIAAYILLLKTGFSFSNKTLTSLDFRGHGKTASADFRHANFYGTVFQDCKFGFQPESTSQSGENSDDTPAYWAAKIGSVNMNFADMTSSTFHGVQTLQQQNLRSHQSTIKVITANPLSRGITASADESGTICIWNAHTGDTLTFTANSRYTLNATPNTIAWTAQYEIAVGYSTGHIVFFNTETGKHLDIIALPVAENTEHRYGTVIHYLTADLRPNGDCYLYAACWDSWLHVLKRTANHATANDGDSTSAFQSNTWCHEPALSKNHNALPDPRPTNKHDSDTTPTKESAAMSCRVNTVLVLEDYLFTGLWNGVIVVWSKLGASTSPIHIVAHSRPSINPSQTGVTHLTHDPLNNTLISTGYDGGVLQWSVRELLSKSCTSPLATLIRAPRITSVSTSESDSKSDVITDSVIFNDERLLYVCTDTGKVLCIDLSLVQAKPKLIIKYNCELKSIELGSDFLAGGTLLLASRQGNSHVVQRLAVRAYTENTFLPSSKLEEKHLGLSASANNNTIHAIYSLDLSTEPAKPTVNFYDAHGSQFEEIKLPGPAFSCCLNNNGTIFYISCQVKNKQGRDSFIIYAYPVNDPENRYTLFENKNTGILNTLHLSSDNNYLYFSGESSAKIYRVALPENSQYTEASAESSSNNISFAKAKHNERGQIHCISSEPRNNYISWCTHRRLFICKNERHASVVSFDEIGSHSLLATAFNQAGEVCTLSISSVSKQYPPNNKITFTHYRPLKTMLAMQDSNAEELTKQRFDHKKLIQQQGKILDSLIRQINATEKRREQIIKQHTTKFEDAKKNVVNIKNKITEQTTAHTKKINQLEQAKKVITQEYNENILATGTSSQAEKNRAALKEKYDMAMTISNENITELTTEHQTAIQNLNNRLAGAEETLNDCEALPQDQQQQVESYNQQIHAKKLKLDELRQKYTQPLRASEQKLHESEALYNKKLQRARLTIELPCALRLTNPIGSELAKQASLAVTENDGIVTAIITQPENKKRPRTPLVQNIIHIYHWDSNSTETAKEQISYCPLVFHSAPVSEISLSKDGKRLTSISQKDHSVGHWHLEYSRVEGSSKVNIKATLLNMHRQTIPFSCVGATLPPVDTNGIEANTFNVMQEGGANQVITPLMVGTPVLEITEEAPESKQTGDIDTPSSNHGNDDNEQLGSDTILQGPETASTEEDLSNIAEANENSSEPLKLVNDALDQNNKRQNEGKEKAEGINKSFEDFDSEIRDMVGETKQELGFTLNKASLPHVPDMATTSKQSVNKTNTALIESLSEALHNNSISKSENNKSSNSSEKSRDSSEKNGSSKSSSSSRGKKKKK